MEIDLPVHLVAAHQVIFHSMHAAVLDDHLVLRGPHHTEYALHVEVAVADTRIVRITLEIVHAGRLYLGGDHADDQFVFMGLVDHLRNLQRVMETPLFRYGIDFHVAAYDLTAELLLIRIENRHETMGKRAVPEVVEQCRTEYEQTVFVVPLLELPEVHNHASDDFVYTEGMVES